jgi:hypothetical protein
MSKLIRILDSEPKNIKNLLDNLRVRPLKNTVIIEDEEEADLAPITSLEVDFDCLDRTHTEQVSYPSSPPQHNVSNDENNPQKSIKITSTPDLILSPDDEVKYDDINNISEHKHEGISPKSMRQNGEPKNQRTTQGKKSNSTPKIGKKPDNAQEPKSSDSSENDDQQTQSLSGIGRPFSGRVDVEHQEQTKEDSDQHNSDERLAIEELGIKKILAYEVSEMRHAKRLEGNNPGYDIESIESDGSKRYIEVKTFSGEWPKFGGVKLSDVQFCKAQKEQDNFWLYVVEYAKSDNPQIHCIQNPVEKIKEFYFDNGWRTLSEQDLEHF